MDCVTFGGRVGEGSPTLVYSALASVSGRTVCIRSHDEALIRIGRLLAISSNKHLVYAHPFEKINDDEYILVFGSETDKEVSEIVKRYKATGVKYQRIII